MKDVAANLAKLREEAAACAVLGAEARQQAKQELFLRLSEHLTRLADEVEKAINSPVDRSEL